MIIMFIVGFLIAKMFFFIKKNIWIKNGIIGMIMVALSMVPIYLVSIFYEISTIVVIIITYISIIASGIIFLRKGGKIKLYTDGITIDGMVIPYDEVIFTDYATGEIEKNIPKAAKGKKFQLLTPIDYEYIEEDFGVFHHYCFIVTKTHAYVLQSLTGRSAFVANVRNAWACFIYDKQHESE